MENIFSQAGNWRIARHIEWKGIQYILPAFKIFQKKYPEAQLVLANASGPFHLVIEQSLVTLSLNHVISIHFEDDIVSLFNTFDIYVHTPVDSLSEAFGQTYVESLAIGIPSVFSLSGIAREFIIDEENALVVPFKDSVSTAAAIERLWEDKALSQKLIESGRKSVLKRFQLQSMIDGLRKLYDEEM